MPRRGGNDFSPYRHGTTGHGDRQRGHQLPDGSAVELDLFIINVNSHLSYFDPYKGKKKNITMKRSSAPFFISIYNGRRDEYSLFSLTVCALTAVVSLHVRSEAELALIWRYK